MYNYIDESTNDISNPFNRQPSLKQKLIDETPPQPYDQDYSQTIANRHLLLNNEEETIKPGKLPKKIQASTQQPNHQASPKNSIFDDNLTKTRKIKNNKTIKSQPSQENFLLSAEPSKKAQINLQLVPEKIIIPMPTPEVQSIIQGPKLREKYGNLLPKAHQKTLSFQQHHLLKVFSIMDETIEFSNQNRSNKFIFFEELRKNIRDSLRVFVEMKHLQQLLYLDESLFEVKWQYSCQKRGFDIMITLPKIKSKDQRKTKVRQIIVQYLNQKHKQFLVSKGLKPNQNDGPWHPEFQPSKYEIPRKNIPVHPETRDAQLRCFDQNKIEEIKNTKLKQLIQTKKQQSQVQSFKSKSVMDMIFSGVSSKNIQSQILKAVKQKEQNVKKNKILEEERIEKQKTEIDPQILKDISQTILFIYMSKNSSTMFKVKLIEIVKAKTNNKFGNYIVDRHIEHLIELKEIGYLKELVAGKNKPVMVQINKAKAKQITAYTEKLKQKLKQERQQSNNYASAQMNV